MDGSNGFNPNPDQQNQFGQSQQPQNGLPNYNDQQSGYTQDPFAQNNFQKVYA